MSREKHRNGTPGKQVYRFEPNGWDTYAPHQFTPKEGTLVRKVQPFGCPRNGTMGQCYVEDAVTGAFYGMVSEGSLVKVGKGVRA